MKISVKRILEIKNCKCYAKEINIINAFSVFEIENNNNVFDFSLINESNVNIYKSIILMDFISINLNYDFLNKVKMHQELKWFQFIKEKIDEVVIECENDFIQKKINFFEGLCNNNYEFEKFHDTRWVHKVILISADNKFFDFFSIEFISN